MTNDLYNLILSGILNSRETNETIHTIFAQLVAFND